MFNVLLDARCPSNAAIQLTDLFAKGTDSKSIDNARKLLSEGTSRIEKFAQDSHFKWDILHSFVRSAPGGKEALEKHPHIKDFVAIAGEKGDEAKKLAQETFNDIMSVLEEKGKKAQKLKESMKDEVKGRK